MKKLLLFLIPLLAFGQANHGGAISVGPIQASGSGTVTSVSVTTANGVSGAVATATTTPAITITLGAITPTTVNGNTFTAGAYTLTGTAAKTLTFTDNITFGSDGTGTRTLNIGAGGTLGALSFITPGTGIATALAINTGSVGAPVLFNGAGGTPTSLTLTNATGLPVSGITASTSTALGVGSIELGAASDTTIARASAGVVTIEGVNVSTVSSTDTLTNKRVTPRVNTVASSATPTMNSDTTDFFTITALAAAITSMTTNLSGTPTGGQKLTIRILDNGTARAITWGASFASRGGTLPTTTVISKYLYVGFIWNDVAATWDCIATAQE